MEKEIKPMSGIMMLLLAFFGIPGIFVAVAAISDHEGLISFVGILCTILFLFFIAGLFIVNPNDSKLLVLFGDYKGTVKKNGFYWTIPFYIKKKVTLRARNFESDRGKVNDSAGNPIIISVIVVWRVLDAYKAAFDVDDYVHFVRLQSDAAVRNLAAQYPYDNMSDDEAEITLRSGRDELNQEMERQLSAALNLVGIEVIEARIGYLAYAPEIASAMLQRQQAEAVVAARNKIVEGAVGMIESALQELQSRKIVDDLTQAQKAEMVGNLMTVLCSDRETVPVVNVGE